MELFIDSKEYKENLGQYLHWNCFVCGKEFEQTKRCGRLFCSISCFLDWKQEMKDRFEEYKSKTMIWLKGGVLKR